MNRTGLLIALAVLAVTGIVFALWPGLDLAIARLSFSPGAGFPLQYDRTLSLLRDVSMIIVGLLVAPAALSPLIKLLAPHRPALVSPRAATFLIVTLLLGPLLLANAILKDQWSRPRPREVVEFGGPHQFKPWWDPRGACADNCSFVAGEAAGAAWTFAPAALAPPQWRVAAYTAAFAFTAIVGGLRMAFGGHFFSDVIFGAGLTFLVIWLAYALIYRRPADQTADGPRLESYSSLQKGPP